jgi:hypothetical protein
MAYLHLFDTKSAHDAVYNGEGYNEPWVGYITADTTVTYNKVAVIDYKNIPGSIIYAESNGTLNATSKDEWNASLGTPVAVVVIPASHMPDGKCRGMSLCNMSYVTPQEGTLGTGNDNAVTNGTNFRWGVGGTDVAGLTNYQSLMFSDGQTSRGNRHFPSDLYKGMSTIEIIGNGTYPITVIDNTVDTETSWWSEIGEGEDPWDGPYEPPFAISPYASDGSQNPSYLTAGQALADMDGKANTEVLVNLSAIKDTYSSGAFANDAANYPAAFACHLFSTIGTEQNQWYLPALGELGYLYTRVKKINESLTALGDSAVQFGDLTNDSNSLGLACWSSSECDAEAAWSLELNGNVFNRLKGEDFGNQRLRVRAFAAFDI